MVVLGGELLYPLQDVDVCVAEVINDEDVVTFLKKLEDGVRADEAETTNYHDKLVANDIKAAEIEVFKEDGPLSSRGVWDTVRA